jgi:predicted PurR-regulated permease PerM
MIADSGLARSALVIVAVVVAAYALFWLRGILSPLALALFLMVMIDGLARWLADRAPFLPEWAALPVALLLTVLGFVATVYIVADTAPGFAGELVAAAPRLDALLADLAMMAGISAPPALKELVGQLNPARYVGTVVNGLQTFAGGAMYVMVYLGFLIASRQGFQKKVAALYPEASDRDHAAAVFMRIRNGVERYLWIQTVTGLMIAILAWGAMALVGQNHALFWGFLIFAVCYIPVVGGFLGGVLPPLFALVQFTTWWQAAVLFAWIQAVMFLVGSVVLPKMQKDSLNIDPVVVLLSLAFWGAIWGIPGMFLSTPLTVMAIIILAQFDGSRWLAILLSGDGQPEPDPVPTRPPRALAAPEPKDPSLT